MKKLLAAFIEDGLRGGKGAGVRTPSFRSPLPIARPGTGITVPALSNTQIAAILDVEDAHGGR